MMSVIPPITVLVSFRNRPLYLWACLDALFRITRMPARFVLIDMASDDLLIAEVVSGFARRGMIAREVRMDRNDPALLIAFVRDNLAEFGEYFAYVEGDAVVVDDWGCWLTEMSALMRQNPRLAMLGSAIDPRDFVDPQAARRLMPQCAPERIDALIKASSPERGQGIPPPGVRLFEPHNPAGRLMLLRTAALREVGVAEDWVLHQRLIAAGYSTAVATRVRHRHLSLLNIFDYPEYDLSTRDQYMAQCYGEL